MRIISGFLGRIMMILGLVTTVPLLYAVFAEETTCVLPFIVTAIGSVLLGLLLYLTRDKNQPSTTQAMAICTLSWLSLSVLGAIPFVLILDAGWIDAIFETMSGFTTTGITMFTNLDEMPASLILWRSLTQWVGGLGILTFFLAVASKVPGAHKLIGAESHKISSGRPAPGLQHTLKILWGIYSLFTVAVILALSLAGMGLMDSINNGLTTISTGGFCPHDSSIRWYQITDTGNHVLIEYILIVGMIAGGINFLIHYRVFSGKELRALFSGSEVKLWWTFIIGFTCIIFFEQYLTHQISFQTFESSFRKNLFQVSSIMSTTGFGTENLYSPFFGPVARQLFLVMMIIGGCAGSTSGGIKVLRIAILWKVACEGVRKLFRAERAVSGTRFEKELLGRGEISRLTGILFLWFLILAVGGAITALLAPETGSYKAYSGIFSALSNIGPSLISVDQMIGFHWGIKITYIFAMLAGRLEILPVLLLFNRNTWK